MPKLKLTDLACQRLHAPPGERADHFDATLPGFALRVSGPTSRSPEGRKEWVVFYRHSGQQKRLTLDGGGYPAVGLADARDKARAIFHAVGRGQDPAVKQRAIPRVERGPDTVERVVEQFMRRHMIGKDHSPSYIATTRHRFDRFVLPHWRGRLIGDITRRDVIDLVEWVADLGAETNPNGRRKEGGPASANHTLWTLCTLFNWAIRRGLVETSPATLVERPGAIRKRTRVLSDAELRLVWRATETLAYPLRQYFRLLIATGQRRSEVARARWRDINTGEAVWLLAAEDTKSNRAHAVPLSPLALAILDETPQGTGEYIFSVRRRKRREEDTDDLGEAPISGFSTAKAQLDAAIARLAAATGEPVPPPFGLHDLRRTAATTMGRLGVQRFVVARVLAHADREVTGVYDLWSYRPEKADALDRWGRHVETLVNPPPKLHAVA
jgi:integrase